MKFCRLLLLLLLEGQLVMLLGKFCLDFSFASHPFIYVVTLDPLILFSKDFTLARAYLLYWSAISIKNASVSSRRILKDINVFSRTSAAFGFENKKNLNFQRYFLYNIFKKKSKRTEILSYFNYLAIFYYLKSQVLLIIHLKYLFPHC